MAVLNKLYKCLMLNWTYKIGEIPDYTVILWSFVELFFLHIFRIHFSSAHYLDKMLFMFLVEQRNALLCLLIQFTCVSLVVFSRVSSVFLKVFLSFSSFVLIDVKSFCRVKMTFINISKKLRTYSSKKSFFLVMNCWNLH